MSATASYLIYSFLISAFILDYACGTEIPSDLLHRSRRQLLFPNQTLLQLNAGLATPSPRDKVFVNWAFQANFVLPWNRTQIPIDILEGDTSYLGLSRGKREDTGGLAEYQNDARLYHFYKYVEEMLDEFGHNGSSCVLRMLCQLGSEPLHTDDDEDLLHELVSFVLNPKNDLEHEDYKDEIQPYLDAYEKGNSLENCNTLYQYCSISLLDMFSKPYNS